MKLKQKLRKIASGGELHDIACGLPIGTCRELTRTSRQPTHAELLAIARKEDVSIEWLLDDKQGWPVVYNWHEDDFKDDIHSGIKDALGKSRSGYLWPTKQLAEALGIHPNKAGDWWRRTEAKLIRLMLAMPGETAAMLTIVITRGVKCKGRIGDETE